MYRDSFADAVQNENVPAYLTCYDDYIQQKTNDTFLQITNCPDDISFANNILVELINICQEVIQTLIVNENYFYNEFLHPITGKKQIAFEFGNLGVDYGEELLFLRIKHTVSNAVWYSYCFTVTDKNHKETTFFEYKNENYFKGIAYDVQNFYQTIRLKCFETDPDSVIAGEEYTQLPGSIISLRPIITPVEKYIFYMCNKFIYKRLVTLLNHDIIYINNYRISNKPKPTKSERVEDSNFFDVSFDANPTEEYRATEYQIYQGLECISSNPGHNSRWSVASFAAMLLSSSIKLQFNKPITTLPGYKYQLYRDGILEIESPFSTITGSILGLDDLQSFAYIPGTYNIVIPPDVVNHNNELWGGFAYGDLTFTVALPDYKGVDYDSPDYLT